MNDYKYIDGFSNESITFTGAYCFSSERSDYHFLLGKNGCSIIIDSELLGSLLNKEISENFMFKLVQHGMASAEGSTFPHDEYEELCKGDCIPEPLFFIIDITKKCNLNCIYCFRDLNDRRTITMETLEDICRYILKLAHEMKRSSINIQLWGGEPLLAFEQIEYVCSFFKAADVHAVIDIETNGTLITDEIAEKLYDMGIRVGISIDGLPEHQNRQRPTADNRQSMPLLQKGIDSLRKYYGNNVGGITVITKYNYKDIAEIIKYYICTLGILNIKFNIVKDNPNASEMSVGLTLPQVSEFAEKLCDVVELYNALGIPFAESNISTRLDNLNLRMNSSCCISNGCKGGRALISIDMRGDVYPCDMTDHPELKIGSIYDPTPLGKQIMSCRDTNVFFKKKHLENCAVCPWIYYCKGGCTSRIRYSDFSSGIDEVECAFNRTVYPRLVRGILNRKYTTERKRTK